MKYLFDGRYLPGKYVPVRGIGKIIKTSFQNVLTNKQSLMCLFDYFIGKIFFSFEELKCEKYSTTTTTTKMQSQRQQRIRSQNKSRRNALRTLRRRDTVGLLLFGSCEAGKSALVNRWIRGYFVDHYEPTVEDFHVKPYRHMGQCVNVGIIDMTGSWDFAAMIDLYLSRIDSVLFVYDTGADISNTVNDLKMLHDRLIKVRGECYEVLLTVIGTKIDRNQDLDNYRNKEMSEFLLTINVPEERHVLTSAKLNLNVSEAFESALNEVIENMMPNEDSIKRLGKLIKDNKKNNSCFKKLFCGFFQ